MSTLVPLAHGALGIWDELIPLLILVGFGVMFALAAVVGHFRDKALAKKQDAPTVDSVSDNAPRTDHIRLD